MFPARRPLYNFVIPLVAEVHAARACIHRLIVASGLYNSKNLVELNSSKMEDWVAR
jgi:hypothetical protein